MEAAEHIGWHNGRVVLFDGDADGAVCWAVDKAVCVVGDIAVGGGVVLSVRVVGQGMAADKRGGDVSCLPIWREQVVSDVLYEDSFALFGVSTWIFHK